jgi:topoisomerase-4 subunit B
MSEQNQYTEDNIRSLDWKEHIHASRNVHRKTGDGSSADDGIYILVKEFSITVSMNLQWAWKNY